MMHLLSDPRVRVLVNEAFLRRRILMALFVAVNVAALLVAVFWKEGYTASATILASEKNIIQPLMQGTAVPTELADRARMAREIINGRKVMNQVVEVAGWITPNAPEDEREEVIDELNRRVTISNVGRNIIKIEYRDASAAQAFRTTTTLADIFIKESLAAKAAESQAAFEFIDSQTMDYHQKLIEMEERLKQFRMANVDAGPGSDGDVNARLNAFQQRIEQSQQELKEAEIKRNSLERQLSGEAESASAISREGQYQQRIAELKGQLDTLLLNYHDTYPDVVRIRHQIADLNEAIAQERQRRAAARAAGQTVVNEPMVNNPIYQQLKRDLSQTQITIETLRGRIAEARGQLQAAMERGKRAHGGDATLAELTRDYQVTRDIYQDLLRRRENARVSMNMDRENQGLTFKIQEPATLPQAPTGIQFWHVVAVGLLLSLVIPIVLLYGLIYIDPRIRQPQLLADRYQLPMLVSVPHLWSPQEVATVRREATWLGVAVASTLVVVALTVVLRSTGVV